MRILLLTLAVCCLPGALCPAAPPPSKPRFLIVAPQAFRAALAPFVRHKKKQLTVKLVSLEPALKKSAGADHAERLKRFLFADWKKFRTQFVLLVGDADVLPVRYMVLDRKTAAAFNYAFYPSDLYYADLARGDGKFDDWNARRDGFHAGYYGEVRGEHNKDDPINYDNVDYRPDVALGRWPVSHPAEVATVVAKTIRYEKRVLSGKSPQLAKAAFVAVGGWVDTRGVFDRMESYLTPRWQVAKRYYKDGKRDDGLPPPDHQRVRELLNGGVGLLFHTGHGQDDRWEKCLKVSQLAQIDNADRLPIVLSAGCSTARFATLPPYDGYIDVKGRTHAGTNRKQVFKSPPPPPANYQKGRFNNTGLGEQLLRRGKSGAVAYIGCNTGSQPCGVTLLRGFAKAVGTHPEYRLGECWSFALKYYYERERLEKLRPTKSWYPASIFFQGMKFMLFGDPTLVMPAAGR